MRQQADHIALVAMLSVALLAVMIAGCSTLNLGGDDPNIFERLAAITEADRAAAEADALAHNDLLALTCWRTLARYIGGVETPSGEIKGVLSAYQRARDLRRSAGAGAPDDLRLGCSAMVQDSRDFVLKMAVIAGSRGALSGGLPGLSLIGPSLP